MNIEIFQVGLLSLLFLSCQSLETEIIQKNQKENNIDSMRTININQNRRSSVERETPFITRKFDPYLNGKWIGKAVCYGCYREGQAPGGKGPSESQILEDMQIITDHWNLIRIYSSDDVSERILSVIKSYNLPIRVMLGVWLENETNSPQRRHENTQEVLRAIKLANEYTEIISAIIVGNETQVFWSAHKMEINDLIYYVRMVRNSTTLPVTTADDYNFWNRPASNSVAEEIDLIVTHIYPLWNGQTLGNSIEWMSDIFFNQVKKSHPDKTLVLGEIGWATSYDSTKTGEGEQGMLIKGEVSLRAQEKFLSKLSSWIDLNKIPTFLFEAFDEPWKGGGESTGPDEIEKHWGVYYEDRTPKESFQNYMRAYLRIGQRIK